MIKPEALAALKNYVQADEDGVMVNVSRQALDEAIAALAATPAVGGEDLSCVADMLDDIKVNAKGMCLWSDVANAQTHIRYALRAAQTASPLRGREADPLFDLVEGFAKALLAKLRLASANGRSGWERDDWEKQCQQGLLRHLEKGDPRDVAAYCAFMWHHDWITSPPEQPAADPVTEIQPHIYSPDYQAMGDCRVCGHERDKPWHALSTAPNKETQA